MSDGQIEELAQLARATYEGGNWETPWHKMLEEHKEQWRRVVRRLIEATDARR